MRGTARYDPAPERLPFAGLRHGPAQVFGAVRLVPLLRGHVPGDLRLGLRPFAEAPDMVGLRGDAAAPDLAYFGFIPHAFVVRWSDDGAPVAAYGGQLAARGQAGASPRAARIVHRMAKREDPSSLRFLPLHLAFEGFLSLHFGGPDVAWTEYSREAMSHGLSPRSERVVPGAYVAGLEDALRMFEIHHAQVGALVFVADALAALLVVPHPDDYRAIHRTLIRDFFGELIYQYGRLYDEAPEHRVRLADASDLDGLRRAVGDARAEWAEFTAEMAAGVLQSALRWQTIHRAGPFRLRRFLSALRPGEENHVGEAIVRDTGELEYCKTFRLSAAQVRRAYLLEQLAAHAWDLARAADELGCTREALIVRIRNAGFGYLLKDHVLAALPP